MDTTKMSLVRKVIYRVIMLLFIVLFVVIFVGTVFDNRSLIYAENPLVMLLMFTITTIFFVVVYKLIFKKIDDDISIKKELAIAGALMIVFVILQGIFLYNRATYPSWDWKDVLYGARDYVMGRTDLIDWTYFQNYPNNSAMLHIEVILFKILNFFGLLTEKSAIVSTMIVNWVIIDCSALLIYLTVRSLFNKRMALFSIVICIFSYAFYSYLPTFYTDTVTMIFPILIIYLYVKFIKNKNSWYLVWGGVVSLIGYKIKPTVIIALIAIVIDMLVRFRPKEIFRGLGVLVTASVVTFAIIWGLETKFNIFPFDINNNDQAIPWTHWVMMGMTERKSQMANRSYVGWYNPDSYKYTLSFEGVNERKAADLVKIREQYEDYGFWGYMVFLYRKMLYTWSDTTFFAPFLVNNTPVFWESEEFIGDRPEAAIIHKVIFDQSVGVMLFMYLCMIAGAIYNLVKGKNKLSYVFLAILGLLTFLLIWEDSSRYLITYYPLIVVCAMYGFNVIMNINRKSIKMSKAGSKNGKPKERKHAKRTNSLHSGAVL